MARRHAFLWPVPVVVILALAIPATLAAAAIAAPIDDDHAGNLGVTIIDPSASPSPSAPAPSPGGSGGAGGGAGGGGGSAEQPIPSPGSSNAPDGSDGSGIIVSGLITSYQGTLNPLGGWVHASVSVTNSTDEVYNGTFVIRLLTPLGTPIGPALVRQVSALQPGRVQVSTVDLPGVAQWPLVEVTADLTERPASPDAAPIHRERWVFSLPWMLLSLLVLVVAAFVIVRLVRPGWLTRRGGDSS